MDNITLQLKDRIVEVEVRLKKNMVNARLRVDKNGEVIASAPLHASRRYVEEFVRKNVNWIDKQLRIFEETSRNATTSQADTLGETTQYLGESYAVKVEWSSVDSVELDGKNIILRLTNITDNEYANKVFYKWLFERAYTLLDAMIERLMPIFSKLNVQKPTIAVKKIKSYWGKCFLVDKRVVFNVELMRADISCIESVALHELTHFIYIGHGKKFYQFLERHMPDYRARAKALKAQAIAYIR